MPDDGTYTERQASDLVDAICDLMDEEAGYEDWSPNTRKAYQDMILLRVANELAVREV